MHDDNHLNAKRVKMNQGGHIYEKKAQTMTAMPFSKVSKSKEVR